MKNKKTQDISKINPEKLIKPIFDISEIKFGGLSFGIFKDDLDKIIKEHKYFCVKISSLKKGKEIEWIIDLGNGHRQIAISDKNGVREINLEFDEEKMEFNIHEITKDFLKKQTDKESKK